MRKKIKKLIKFHRQIKHTIAYILVKVIIIIVDHI